MKQIYLVALEFIFVISKVADITVPNGLNAYITIALEPVPVENEPVSIVNAHGENVLSISQEDYQVATGYTGRIDVPTYKNETIRFILTNVSNADGGKYFALYTTGQSVVTLLVLGKPKKPKIKIIKYPILSKTLKINCSSESTSAPLSLAPALQYRWKLNEKLANVSYRILYNGQNLEISNIKLEDAGKQILCLAYEIESLMSEPSEPFLIDVHHPPFNLTLTPDLDHYRLPPSKSVPNITCSAICNPSCIYKWLKEHDNDFDKPGRLLALRNVAIYDAGVYYCLVKNNVSLVKSSSIEVLVTEIPEQPVIVEISPPEDAGNLVLMCVENTHSVHFTYYNIKEFKWKIAPDDPNVQKRKIQLNSSFILPKPKTEDSGKEIRCKFVTVDGYSSSYSDPYIVNPTYGPRNITLTPEGPKIFFTNLSDLPKIACAADCNPRCTTTWFESESNIPVDNGSVLDQMQIGEMYYCEAKNRYNRKMSSNITIQLYDKKDNIKQNWKFTKIVIVTSGTSAGIIVVVILGFCFLVRIKKGRKKKKTMITLQKIRERLNQIENQTETRHEAAAENSHNEDKASYDDPTITCNVWNHDIKDQNMLNIRESQLSSNGNTTCSNRTYDDAEYVPDYQNELQEYSSYEELHNVRKSSSYVKVGSADETGQTKDVHAVDNDSNMADDEISNSPSSRE